MYGVYADSILIPQWAMGFGYRVTVQAEMRRQQTCTFWVNSLICLYRLEQQPYSRIWIQQEDAT